MRTIYLVDHEWPPTGEDLAAAQATGAAEVICGIPPALADAGIDTFGYHEIPDPPEPRRLIRKSVIQERINALGKLGDAFAVLNSQPVMFGRWFAPDWPNVYADDPDMLALFAAIGLTADQIAAVTAPA